MEWRGGDQSTDGVARCGPGPLNYDRNSKQAESVIATDPPGERRCARHLGRSTVKETGEWCPRSAALYRDIGDPGKAPTEPVADLTLNPGNVCTCVPRGLWHAASADQGTAPCQTFTVRQPPALAAEAAGDGTGAATRRRAPRHGRPGARRPHPAGPDPAQACVLGVASCPGVTDFWPPRVRHTGGRRPMPSLQPSLTAAKLREWRRWRPSTPTASPYVSSTWTSDPPSSWAIRAPAVTC